MPFRRPRAAALAALSLTMALTACSKQGDGSSAGGSAPEGKGEIHSGSKERPQVVTPSPFRGPPEYAELLKDYRKTWTNLTGYEHSGLHWGQFVTIYVNKEPDRYVSNFLEYVRVYLNEDIEEDEEEGEAGAQADTSKHFQPYSQGTIFLKEHFLPDQGKPGRPLSLTLMIKREPGYDPGGGDWEYVQVDTTGRVLFQGNSKEPVTQQMCIKCHANMAERDYIFSTYCTIATPPQ